MLNTSAQTLFVPAQAVAALVAKRGVARCIADIEHAIKTDLLRWHDFAKCPRTAHYGPQGVVELMPVGTVEHYAFKYVNGHPDNVQLNLPTVMALGVLADMRTGFPKLLADLTLITALRTAAMSVLMARYMARADAQCMAIIGNGAQSEFQALGFALGLGIKNFRVMDIDAQASAKLANHLRAEGLAVQVCGTVAEAVQGADIITMATADKRHAALLDSVHVAKGVHVNAIGGDCPGKTELTPALLNAVDCVCVEYAPQSRVEGDVQQMPENFEVIESWQLVQGICPGRVHQDERTVFDSVGFALEDFSALTALWQWATEQEMDDVKHEHGPFYMPLLPQLPDPKNLYASLGFTKKSVHLLGVPSDMGGNSAGAQHAPAVLRGMNLLQNLKQLGLTAIDQGDVSVLPAIEHECNRLERKRLVHDYKQHGMAQLAGLVYERVARSLAQGARPVVLGGDHSVVLGSLHAVAAHCRQQGKPLHVVWMDAHADFNTPQSSPSGNLHGMPLASLCGIGPKPWVHLCHNPVALCGAQISLVGVRDIDAEEKQLLDAAGVAVFDMQLIQRKGIEVVMQQVMASMPQGAHVHLSFDMDVIDPQWAPGVDTAVNGGLDVHSAYQALQMLARMADGAACAAHGQGLGSIDWVEFNPLRDVDNQTAKLSIELLSCALGGTV